uniref:Uncharacterized protein n=1 Tax=Plectus sambesii TaxID=2011161 RepID=A0A914XN34_9BILA
MKWRAIVAILCAYGFLKEFKPSEPYLYQFQNEDLNLTAEVLNDQVYPYWTYSYLIALIPVFLLTDLLLYKPVLLLESLCYVAVWLTLLFGRTIWSQQLGQLFYGWASATEIAYYSYIYAKVDKEKFQRVTSFTRAAVQGGKCFAYLLSQPILSFHWGTYWTLNYISLGSVSTIFFFALLLPRVEWKVVAHNDTVEHRESPPPHLHPIQLPQTYRQFVLFRTTKLWQDFKRIYSNAFICKWSLWWALATCGTLQIGNYIQTLWGTVQEGLNDADVYNGLTEAVTTALGTITILLMQLVHVRWEKWGEIVLTVISLIDCALLILLSQLHNMWIMYVAYICYRVFYQMMITIAQFNLARKLQTESYGLLFGFNTFIALGLQTLLTFAVDDERGFQLPIRKQFIVYGAYHGAIATIFFITGVVTRMRISRRASTAITPEIKY